LEGQGAKREKKKGKRGIITGVKLGIKEKRQEKGDVQIIYSKEMKITRRRVKDAMKENSEDCILLGGSSMGEYEKEEQEIGKRIGRMGKENPKTRWKMQRGRDRWNGSKKMDGSY
jgi:hypothetical protein